MKHFRKILFSLATGLLLTTPAVHASKRLNNVVFELTRVDFAAEDASNTRSVSFTTDRDGWIYIGLTGKISDGAQISFSVNDEPETTVAVATEASLPEKMCYVKAGDHRLQIRTDADTVVESVVVRAIPQIVYFSIDDYYLSRRKVDYSVVRSYRSLWEQGVLQNFNVLTFDPASHTPHYKEEITEWRALGRTVITKTSLPKDGKETMDLIDKLWVQPMEDPLSDGIIIDEITPKYQSIIPYWSKVIKEIGQRPELQNKTLYTFNSLGFPELYLPLVESIMESGYYYGPEVYLRNLGDLTGVTTKMKAWREAKPGIEKHMVIFLGPDNMAPGMSFHMRANENYKVFLENQIRLLATEPAFADLAGVGFWSAHYMDDDILRAFARLSRHYLIEGKTEPLFFDPLQLPHLESPGFEYGTKGWKLEAAADKSLRVRNSSIVQYKKSPYSALPEGKKVLYTKRSKEKPNVISQTIRDLEPGRVYHLNVYALDLNHFQKAEPIAVGIRLSGVELLEEHTRNSVIRTKALPKEDKTQTEGDPFEYEIVQGRVNVAWNHYHRLFRATSATAELVISDWDKENAPTGPEGQELIWDFIEVAPNISLEPVLPAHGLTR